MLAMGCGGENELGPVRGMTVDDSTAALPDTVDLTPAALAGPCKGYTIFSNPVGADDTPVTVLIDMQGNVVKKWKLNGFPARMLPGKSVIGSRRMRPGSILTYQDTIELVQQDWNGNELWSFASWDDDGTRQVMSRQHHDYQREGNPEGCYAPGQQFTRGGTTLVLAHKDLKAPAISEYKLTDDVLYEVTAAGKLTDFVWYASDHVEEMGFDTLARTDISRDPNFDSERISGDWLHINSASRLGNNRWYGIVRDERFHPDNIIFGSREANFIGIISRKTGKIVWRVGPVFEGTPAADLGQLVGQHHPHMIPQGLPGAGNILVFDNGGFSGYGGDGGFPQNVRIYSRVLEFDPVTLKRVWQYGTRELGPEHFFSGFISSAQRLPNGNTRIALGDKGELIEVNRQKQVVWRYQSLFADKDGAPFVYRAYRVPPEWLPAGVNPGNYPAWKDLYPVT
jgi:hypothetical protein